MFQLRRRIAAPYFLLIGAVAAMTGCGAKDEIRTYPIPKEAAAPNINESRPVQIAELTHRMIGAIAPAGDKTWYFKAVGPSAAMDKNADQIKSFFQTIQVKAGDAKPQWTLPAGWQEQPGNEMRIATLLIPAEGKPVELSVIGLPTTGQPDELMSNVNRWRKQLQVPPVDERNLANAAKETKAGELTMYVVDVRGQLAPGGMMPPFAGGGPFSGAAQPPAPGPATSGAESQNATNSQSPDLPPGHPAVDARGGPVNEPNDAPFTFKAPANWQAQAASAMRKADFIVQDGEKNARVTVIDLLASAPNVANALENVNRWRKEIALPPIKQEQLAAIEQKIAVGGQPSQYFEMIPDAKNPGESQASEATVAAIVPAGDVIWFFKMRGDRDLVASQREAFKTFLQSVHFTSAGGAGDGNK